jgi:Raf kinase inhibitor-like YbhB/YbcL family protein
MHEMKALFCYGLVATALLGCGGSGVGNDCSTAVNYCNVPPVANPGSAQNVLMASTTTLDGNGSSDQNGNPLTYAWEFVSKPAGSIAVLASSTSAKATFVPDLAGIYLVSLTVSDGKASSPAVTVAITASATNLSVTQAPFANGSAIPIRFAATSVGGSNVTPQLSIGDVPSGTARFAIIMDDEVAPCQSGLGACRHWGVFNLPVAKTFINEGENLLLQSGAVYGTNFTGTVGYMGPSAAAGHTYKLTVYALAAAMPFITGKPEFTRAKFEIDFKDFILGKATLTGVYP